MCVGCVRVGVCVWEGVPALCSLGHCQLDSPPGQWSKHYQQLWLVTIFLQGVFKDLCSCDFLFLFSVVLLFERLRDEEKLETSQFFLIRQTPVDIRLELLSKAISRHELE